MIKKGVFTGIRYFRYKFLLMALVLLILLKR